MKMLLATMLAFATATPASAVVILNADFDSISSSRLNAHGYDFFRSADGFTAGSGAIEIQNGGAGAAYSSRNLVELDTDRNSSMFVALGAGRYNVSYYYSPRPHVGASSNGIDVLLGNRVIDAVALQGGSNTSFTRRMIDFVTTGDRLTFAATGTSDSRGGYLDNITISQVPEPATWSLMIIGFGLVGFVARRGRRPVSLSN